MTQAFETLDFQDFHRAEWPHRLSQGNGALATGHAAEPGSLAFRLNDSNGQTLDMRNLASNA